MQKNIVAKIISVILIIILVSGIILLGFLPKLYDIFKNSNISSFNNHSLIYKVAFYLCYIICLYIVFKLIRLFDIIYKESPFRKEISSSLHIMSILFIVLFIIVIIKSIFIPTLLSFVVAILCFLISLSFYVLKEVIKMAIIYKNEVDTMV